MEFGKINSPACYNQLLLDLYEMLVDEELRELKRQNELLWSPIIL
ncbi:hypothetical protein BWQ96_09611 [Gracilariopsis chorda]|uniref:Uncharacterized protein n=1 Tax=Gracilariopsis chorda TaxID=448386 RepID=A0A2V3IF84_9FLOR|nr:hypothetical protein BWQ96_09611 [Gracilariopsis chorda]|eukprot:PXF40678.1 hypothetical protein BWQ96_09611 [Gracilariopsis chorda]